MKGYKGEAVPNKVEAPAVEWEKIHGDEAIKGLVNENFGYLGHSTSNIEWLIQGKDLRVGKGGAGSLYITAIDMPNTPDEFLEHLKKRIDPETHFYHKGEYVVVLAIPHDLYKSLGQDPHGGVSDPFGFAPMKNVKVIEEKEDHYSAPKRFILGYYEGKNNSFFRNPNWEEKPEATEFGIKAEKKLLNKESEITPDSKAREEKFPPKSVITEDIDENDEVW
jgi:hypothetical protein